MASLDDFWAICIDYNKFDLQSNWLGKEFTTFSPVALMPFMAAAMPLKKTEKRKPIKIVFVRQRNKQTNQFYGQTDGRTNY